MIYYWILDEWCNDDELFDRVLYECWNDEENANVWKWPVWGGYIIVLRWILNRLWDVDWAVMKMGYWWMSNRLWNVDCDWWLASANGIWDGWPNCAWWLASANGIRDGWPGYDCWLASTNGIRDGWPGCAWWPVYAWWLTSTNGIWDGWLSCDWWLVSANDICDGWPGCVD